MSSLVNRILESRRATKIEVGMGATVCHWSDRSPVTIVAIRYAKDGETVAEIDVCGDHVSDNLAVWPDQRYEITPAPLLPNEFCGRPESCQDKQPCIHHGGEYPRVQTWRGDQKGRFRSTYINENGRRVMSSKDSAGISIGDRDYYRDPSF